MPFTPFHMGVAMVFKPGSGFRFSVIAFGLAQVFIDIDLTQALRWPVVLTCCSVHHTPFSGQF